MSVLSIMFSEADIQPVKTGIALYIRLLGMFHSPDPLQLKWISDEDDLKGALRSLITAYDSTREMVGVRKYQGLDYDPLREVERMMTTYLLSGRDEREQALLNKRNRPMFHLVIMPLTRMMTKYSHQMQLDTIRTVVDEVCTMIDSTTCYGDLTDAIVAQSETRDIIRRDEEAVKAIRDSKKRKKHRRDPLIDMILGTVS